MMGSRAESAPLPTTRRSRPAIKAYEARTAVIHAVEWVPGEVTEWDLAELFLGDVAPSGAVLHGRYQTQIASISRGKVLHVWNADGVVREVQPGSFVLADAKWFPYVLDPESFHRKYVSC